MVDEEPDPEHQANPTLVRILKQPETEKAPVFRLEPFLNMVDEEPDPEHQTNPTLFESLNNLKRKRLQSFD
jgi:hypothetical protein